MMIEVHEITVYVMIRYLLLVVTTTRIEHWPLLIAGVDIKCISSSYRIVSLCKSAISYLITDRGKSC
jgi:hypothetical protein